jgi:hypothetical protein
MSEVLSLQVVGFGPAGVGLLVAADRIGSLHHMLRAGVLFLDARPIGPGNSLRFKILSNSPAGEFLEAISATGKFARVLDTPEGKELQRRRAEIVPLSLVATFLDRLYAEVQAVSCAHGIELARLGTAVSALRRSEGGIYESYDAEGHLIARSRNVVLANGAIERLDREALCAWFGRPWSGECVESATLLRGEADHIVLQTLKTKNRIAVLGGSHSSWSVADYLVRNFGEQLGPAAVSVFHRSPMREYYASVLESLREGVVPRECDVCLETGQVNRFDGLRGPSRSLRRSVSAGVEKRVQAVPASRDALLAHDCIITAVGYRTRRIPVYSRHGEPIALLENGAHVSAGARGRLLSASGEPVPNLYGIGIGYAARAGSSLHVGVNLFHGPAAEAIVRDLGYGVSLAPDINSQLSCQQAR